LLSRFHSISYIIFFNFIICFSIFAVELPSENNWLNLNKATKVYTDTNKQFSNLNVLLSGQVDFVSKQQATFIFSDINHWIKVSLTNTQTVNKTSYLTLGHQTIKFLKAYLHNDQNTQIIAELNSASSYLSRPISDPILILPITLKAGETKVLYLHYQMIGHVSLNLKLFSKISMMEYQKKSEVKNNLLLGFLVAILMMVGLHGILNKNLTYLYYAGLMISFIFLICDLSAYNLKYFWPDGGIVAEKSVAIIFSFIPIFHLLFIRQFLNLKTYHKKLNIVYKTFILINICLLILTPWVTLLTISLFLGTLVIPVLCYTVYWSFNQPLIAIKTFSISLFFHVVLINFLTLFAVATGNYILPIELPDLLKVAYTLEAIFFAISLAIQNKALNEQSIFLLKKQTEENKAMSNLEYEFNLSAQSNRIMKQQAIEKKIMLANLSHELRTPLTVMQIEIETLQNDFSDDISATHKSLSNKVEDLTTLISDLSQISQSDIVSLEFSFEKVQLADFFKAIDKELKIFVISNKLIWNSNIEINDREHSILDAAKIRQLLLNLVNNSVKYTDQPGKVELNVLIENTMLYISISDTSPGVPHDQMKRIFDCFYRLEDSRSRNTGGSGLGLSICENIVYAHKGEISAQESDLGGLTILIKLPFTCNETDLLRI